MDRGALWATVHGVTESRTRLSTHTHTVLTESWHSSVPGIVLNTLHVSPHLIHTALPG